MEYSKLVAVSGLPGLFELINSKTDGAIVRSLEDKSSRFVSSRIHNFSHLESIEVYTSRENANLVDIFTAMSKAGASLPDDKDAEAVKKYFEKVYPDMDFERVYSSDMKKMVKWFDILKKNNIEIKLSEIPEEPETPEVLVQPKIKEAPVEKEKVKTKEVKKANPAAEEKADKKKKTEAKKEPAKKKPAAKKK